MNLINFYKKSLRYSVLIPVLLVAVLTLAVQSWVVINSMAEVMSREFYTRGETVANILASSVQEVIDRDIAVVQGFIDEYKELRGIRYIYIVDPQQQVVAHNFIPEFPEELKRLLVNTTDRQSDRITFNGHHVEEIRRGILGGRRGQVHVGIDLDLIGTTARAYAVKLVFIEIIIFGLATILITLILNRLINRIIKISQAARDITQSGNLDQYILIHGEDEVGQLAQEFNVMVMTLKGQKDEIASMLAARTNEVKEARQQLIDQANLSILGEMAGSVAQEVSSPLAVISDSSRHMKIMLQKGMVDIPALTQMAERIEVTIIRIGKIIKGLRSFSRGLDTEPYDRVKLLEVMKDTLELSQDYIETRQVELKVAPVPDATINVRGIQLAQVLVSLLKNGVDAVEGLPVRWIKVNFDQYIDSIEISVTDSGSGIPVEIQEKMMEPFFTTKPAGKASGLGLNMVRSILKDHGGELRFDNRSPNTRFIIKLPIAGSLLFKI